MNENVGKIDINNAELFEADHYDTYLNQDKPDDVVLFVAHNELDPQG